MLHANKMPRFTCYYKPMLKLPNYMHMKKSMYGLKMPAKYWDLVSMYWAAGSTERVDTLANYLLAN